MLFPPALNITSLSQNRKSKNNKNFLAGSKSKAIELVTKEMVRKKYLLHEDGECSL